MTDHSNHIKKDIRRYLFVLSALMIGTIITVWASYIDFGSQKDNIVVAMIIASVKAGLVAAFFMHLAHERPMIYRVLVFTVIFALGLFLLTAVAWHDPITGTERWRGKRSQGGRDLS
jgi:cytochrome c oxidase subunit 4